MRKLINYSIQTLNKERKRELERQKTMCFDWLFNMQIPKSTDRVHVVRPSAGTFVTGIARAYDESYDAIKLGHYINNREY